jgi:uncharacterized repeat protein (TIGR01451 family)
MKTRKTTRRRALAAAVAGALAMSLLTAAVTTSPSAVTAGTTTPVQYTFEHSFSKSSGQSGQYTYTMAIPEGWAAPVVDGPAKNLLAESSCGGDLLMSVAGRTVSMASAANACSGPAGNHTLRIRFTSPAPAAPGAYEFTTDRNSGTAVTGAVTSPVVTVHPVELVFTGQPPTEVDADELFDATVEVRHTAGAGAGTKVTDFAGDVTLALHPSETLSGTTTASAAGGEAAFTDLAVSEPGDYTLVASGVSAGATTYASDTFTVGAGPVDPVADLRFDEIRHLDEVRPGGVALWRFHVRNDGPSAAEDVVVSLDLENLDPEDLLLCNKQNGRCTADDFGPLTDEMDPDGDVTLADIAAGALNRFQLRTTVPEDLEEDTELTVSAVVSAATADGDESNNTVGPLTTRVEVDAVLETAITAPTSVVAGRPIVYDGTITNLSLPRAINVTAIVGLDEALTPTAEYCLGSCTEWVELDGTGRVDVGDVARSARLRVRATVPYDLDPADLEDGLMVGSLSAEWDNAAGPSDVQDVETALVVSSDVRMAVSAAATRTPGQLLAYTATTTNLGPSAARDVAVTATIDEALSGARYCVGTECVLAEWRTWSELPADGIVVDEVDLAPSEAVRVLVRARSPLDDGSVSSSFGAWPADTSHDPRHTNNTVTRTTMVTSASYL